MDTTELTRALRDATARLEPRQGFTTAVVQGGRRRKVHNRTWVAVATATVTAAMGTGAVAGLSGGPGHGDTGRTSTTVPERSRNPMLDQPTRGDLAADRSFVVTALQAYREGIAESPNRDRGIPDSLIGEPRVYWAGTTAAGRVAVVVQGGDRTPDGADSYPPGVEPPPDWNTQRVFVGLIGGDIPRLIDEMPLIGGGPKGGNAFLFGPQDRMVLAFTDRTPLYVSGAWNIRPDGTGQREWKPMTALDGIAFGELPAGTHPADVRVVRTADPARAASQDALLTLPASTYRNGFDRQSKPISDHRLPWPPNSVFKMNLTSAGPLSDMDAIETALAGAGMLDPLRRAALGGFQAVAGLPGNRTVVMFEYQPDNQASRLYAAITKADGAVESLVHGGVLDAGTPIPARLRLPDGQGWAVAEYGAAVMRFRVSAGGPWQDAGRDSALLPDNAVQVGVTKSEAAPVVVNLIG